MTSQKITVTINGTNDLPVLELDKPVLDIKEGDEDVSGKATASDVDKNDQDDLRYSFRDKEGKEGEEETVDGVVWSVVGNGLRHVQNQHQDGRLYLYAGQ